MPPAACDGEGRLLVVLLTEGQAIEYKSAAPSWPYPPAGKVEKSKLDDHCYAVAWLRKPRPNEKSPALQPLEN